MLFNQKTTNKTKNNYFSLYAVFFAQKGRDLVFFSGDSNLPVNTGSTCKVADIFVPTLSSIP